MKTFLDVLRKYPITSVCVSVRELALEGLLSDETITQELKVETLLIATAPDIEKANLHHDRLTFQND